jgi:hypothetical protein
MATFRLAVDDMVDITKSVGDIFNDLQAMGEDLQTSGDTIEASSTTLSNTCTISATQTGASQIGSAVRRVAAACFLRLTLSCFATQGTSMSSAGDLIFGLVDGLGDDAYDFADKMDKGFSGTNYMLVRRDGCMHRTMSWC